jgi:hypothetical protein
MESLMAGSPDAAAITESACDFGQDDDITVLVVRLDGSFVVEPQESLAQ